MVATWKTGPGGRHTCKEFGAVYEITLHRFPIRDRDSADCDVCGTLMREWNSTTVPEFKLVKRPDGR